VKDQQYLYNDVFFNPFVIQIMNMSVVFMCYDAQNADLNSYLGAKPIWNFMTGNNAIPRTHGLRQPVHKDITFFHPQVKSSHYVIKTVAKDIIKSARSM
jgi:hypothetical protein